MRALRREGQGRIGFIVVSDDMDIDFQEKWVLRHKGNPFMDMAVLSCCDMVVGAPSTFNRWSAFVGDRPHLSVWSSDFAPTLNSFKKFKLSSGVGQECDASDINTIRWYGIA